MNDWVVFESAQTSGRYAEWKDKPVLIIHPNGTVYLTEEAKKVLNTKYVLPVTNGKWVGFKRGTETKTYNARRVQVPAVRSGMPSISCKDFIVRTKLSVPTAIRIYWFERFGDVVAVDVSAPPTDSIPYQPHQRNR